MGLLWKVLGIGGVLYSSGRKVVLLPAFCGVVVQEETAMVGFDRSRTRFGVVFVKADGGAVVVDSVVVVVADGVDLLFQRRMLPDGWWWPPMF